MVLVECYTLLVSGECARKISSTYNIMVCAVPVTYKYIEKSAVDMTRLLVSVAKCLKLFGFKNSQLQFLVEVELLLMHGSIVGLATS